jgi:2-polyprenyl-3-methyl-5-hydroxy-6-metoxy-1,4-benzoquinol methylase
MAFDAFCCPTCKNPLSAAPDSLTCTACARHFPIINGIADFFLIEGDQEAIDEVNMIWQDVRVVKARDTIYRLCTRELRGMAFCMQEIARRAGVGTRILEAGMGTGHFTSWMAELAAPGTEIYAFDCSWPILHTAQINLRGLPGVSLFRANSRWALPFGDASFDIVFLRLAPLGPHGTPNVVVGSQLLKPGGWYFEACWDRTQYEMTWTDWAIQHGYAHAEQHSWQYPRFMTEEEKLAWQVEQADFPADHKEASSRRIGNVRMVTENLLIAQKPFDPNPPTGV